MIRRRKIRNRGFEEVIDEAAMNAIGSGYPVELVNKAKTLCLNFMNEPINRRCLFFSMLYVAIMEKHRSFTIGRMVMDFRISADTIRKYKRKLDEILSSESECKDCRKCS